MTFYRQKLLDAVRGLVDDGDLNMRLTHAAGYLIQIDDDDVPSGAFAEFERIRDPLIQRPMISKGEMLPRDFPTPEARAAAHGIVGLYVTSACSVPYGPCSIDRDVTGREQAADAGPAAEHLPHRRAGRAAVRAIRLTGTRGAGPRIGTQCGFAATLGTRPTSRRGGGRRKRRRPWFTPSALPSAL